jgi:hypothetical protein
MTKIPEEIPDELKPIHLPLAEQLWTSYGIKVPKGSDPNHFCNIDYWWRIAEADKLRPGDTIRVEACDDNDMLGGWSLQVLVLDVDRSGLSPALALAVTPMYPPGLSLKAPALGPIEYTVRHTPQGWQASTPESRGASRVLVRGKKSQAEVDDAMAELSAAQRPVEVLPFGELNYVRKEAA